MTFLSVMPWRDPLSYLKIKIFQNKNNNLV